MTDQYPMLTEQRNPATATIDQMSAREIVAEINREDASVATAVAAVGDQIAALVEQTVARMQRGGRLIYLGAGTSGRLGVLDAAECPPTFSVPPGLVIGLIAGGPAALTSAIEAVEDHPGSGAADIAALHTAANDVVLGIAASGRTPYVLGGIAEARQRGALTAGLACSHPSPLAAAVEIMIAPLVGPEVITGSTRMKAGTAQKLVLNTLSTAIMIQLGKTYGNLMVDLQPLNEKLRQRAIRIVATASGVSEDKAQTLLNASQFEPKTAIVMARLSLSADEARQRLQRANGHIYRALQQDT
jgi:N-acetylmuramic acid 6-phosphate etherase